MLSPVFNERGTPLPHHRRMAMTQAASATRTPIAWTLRDVNLSSPPHHPHHPHHHPQPINSNGHLNVPGTSRPASSTTSGGSSSAHPLLGGSSSGGSGGSRDRHNNYSLTMSHPPHHPRYLTAARVNHLQQLRSQREQEQQDHHQRDQQSMQHHQHQQIQRELSHRHHQQRPSRPSSPSSETSSSDDREEVLMVRHHDRRHRSHHRDHHHSRRAVSSDRRSIMSRVSRVGSQLAVPAPPPSRQHYHMVPIHHHPFENPYGTYAPPGITMGTLRSTKSVPALAYHSMTDGGGPGCPVHGGPPSQPPPQTAYSVIHGPIYAPLPHINGHRTVGPSFMDHIVRSGGPGTYSVVNFVQGQGPPLPEKKYAMGGLPLPTIPPPQAVPVGPPPPGAIMTISNSRPQMPPPPTTILLSAGGGPPGKVAYYEDTSCCKGHLIVLWIILSVVTLGVISGIILGVTMN